MAGETGRSGAGAGDREGPPDRRRERGRRTRNRMMEATIDLIESGNPRPTSREVARKAGVSVRLVFHHFRRIEVLVRLAAEHQAARHRTIVTPIPPDGPLPARIRAVCRQRRLLFEATGPVMRAADHVGPDGPGLDEVLAAQRLLLRRQLEITLGPEIDAAEGESRLLLDVLEHTTGWRYWSYLRADGRMTAPAAERAMAAAVTQLLAPRGG